MNGWVRAEFIFDNYMVTELKRMKSLNRPIMKDNQYSIVLAPPDQIKINNMVNMVQDKMRLNDDQLRQVQETLRTDCLEGQLSEDQVRDFLEPYDPESMGDIFVCPNADVCGKHGQKSWKGMMDHAWSNNDSKGCYNKVSQRDKQHYDRKFPSKKNKEQPDDKDVEICPTYAPFASLELLKTLRDAHGQ